MRCPQGEKAVKPNIVLLFTDMQRYDTIHALGNPVIKTPHLDELVKRGVSFTSAYTPSPVCVPARWCMQYGKYPAASKLTDNGNMPPDDGSSLPERLRRLGYRTCAVGKCHFTPDKLANRGFEERIVQEECCSDPAVDDYCRYLQQKGYDCDEPQGIRGEMYYVPQISPYPAADHPSAFVAGESIRYINERTANGENYFLMASFIHPHPPFSLPKPWHQLYRSFEMPAPFVPDDSTDFYTWVNYFQNRYKYQDRGFNRNLQELQIAYYYASISFVDYQIGRILQTLRDHGTLDNTVIVFASDHGEHLGDYGCYGKRSMLDPSSRIPLIAAGPGFAQGQICPTPASLVDVLPTFVHAAGGGVGNTDGLALQQIAAGATGRKYVYSQFALDGEAIYMIASADWKYIYSAGDDKEWLFDRSIGRESVSVPAQNPAVHHELKQALLQYLRTGGFAGAWTQADGKLDWRRYPRRDMSFLRDPKAELLTQDHSLHPFDLPGYRKQE